MRVIGIGSGKGGVGRSIITANLGVALSEMGKSTLVVDGCVTSPDQALLFNLEKAARTINDVLSGNASFREAVYKGPKDVEVLPASVNVEKIKKVDPSRLPSIINEQVEGYDFVLIDTPNGLTREAIAALKSCEELLVLTTPELTSVSDSMKTKTSSEFLGLELIGLIINQVRGEEYEIAKEEIERLMNLSIRSIIPYDEEILRSLKNNRLLLEGDFDSPAAEKIGELASELAEEND